MYRLYVNNGGWEKIGESRSENDILILLMDYNNQCEKYDYMIINHVESINTDLIYKRIRTEESFKEYLLDCKERNLELNSKKKKKKKKLTKNK